VQLSDVGCGVAPDAEDAAGFSVSINEAGAVNLIAALPADGEVSLGFLDEDRLRVPLAGLLGLPLNRIVIHGYLSDLLAAA
jgi:hypothetical protein